MILSNESNVDINTALFIMASLSPKVKESIDLELYRVAAESDGSTDQYILDDAFVNLIKDLETIGVTFSIDYSDMTEEVNKLLGFLQFVSYLLPNSLYDILKTNARIRECVSRILEGSLGDNETLIQTYLSQLGGLDEQSPLVPELVHITDQYYPLVSQTELFTDYMRNLFDLVLHERMTIESDPESHKRYRDTIRVLIGQLSDAINSFSGNQGYDQLCFLQDHLIGDLAAPSNFTEYCYLLTESSQTLPEELIPSYQQKWYHYKVSHRWCPEYFPLRKLEASYPETLMMYCFMYALSASEEAFISRITDLRRVYPLPNEERVILALYKE